MKVLIGKIVKPQGVKGELKVLCNDNKLEQYKNIKHIYLGDSDNFIAVKDWKVRQGFVYLTLPNVFDRTQAEKYRNLDVYVEDSEVNLNPNTYFTDDLIGCEVYDENNNYLSTIVNIENYGATDIFVVMQEGRELMVPFVTKIFYKVDIKNKKLFAYFNLYNEAAV